MSVTETVRHISVLSQLLQVRAASTEAYERQAIAHRVFGEGSNVSRLVNKAALGTGDLGSDADYRAAAAAFLETVRKRSLMGKITGWRRVGFDARVMTEETPITAAWTAEGAAKHVASTSLDSTKLAPRKVAGILPMTKESMMLAGPVTTNALTRSLTNAVAAMESASLIDPGNAGVAGEEPASILYGAPNQATTGTPQGDVAALLSLYEGDLDDAVIVTNPRIAVALYDAGYLNAGARGGDVAGIPLVTSDAVPFASSGSTLAIVNPSRILLADDGISMDVSSEAFLNFSDAGHSITPTAAAGVSLWQTNTLAVLIERSLNWQAVDGTTAYISGVDYATGS